MAKGGRTHSVPVKSQRQGRLRLQARVGTPSLRSNRRELIRLTLDWTFEGWPFPEYVSDGTTGKYTIFRNVWGCPILVLPDGESRGYDTVDACKAVAEKHSRQAEVR